MNEAADNATQTVKETSKPAFEACPLCEKGFLQVTGFNAKPGRPVFQMGQSSVYAQSNDPTVTVRCTEAACTYEGKRPGFYHPGSLYPLQQPNG